MTSAYGSSQSLTTGAKTAEGGDYTSFSNVSAEEIAKAEAAEKAENDAIENAIASGNSTIGTIVVDDKEVIIETKNEIVNPTEEPEAPEYGDTILDVAPDEVIKDTSTEEEIIDDTAKVEEKEEASEEELDNMVNDTITTEDKEEIEEQPVEQPEEDTSIDKTPVEEEITNEIPVETPEVQVPELETEVEEPKEEVIEQPVVTPVSVAAVDGYETVVGSQIQFVIDGTDVQINGLDGIEYSFNGGILTINVGQEATTLTVEVCNSVSSQVFNILVNGIVG